MSQSDARPGLFERPGVIRTIIALIVLICAGLVVAAGRVGGVVL